ncbi:MAG: helix-turn-helix transcriptional regulator [Gemmatimonadota bacterium]
MRSCRSLPQRHTKRHPPWSGASRVEECDRIVFTSDSVVLGQFRCPPSYADFPMAGRIHYHLTAFPHRAVWIEREDAGRFVADPGLATLYNPGQAYQRRSISRHGDESDWIGMSEAVARDIVRHFSDGDADREAPLCFFRAPVANEVYMAQQALFERALHPESDALEIEESAIAIVSAVLRGAYDGAGRGRCRQLASRGTELVEAAKSVIMATLFENLSVSDLAKRIGVSVFHLCRTFRGATGSTLHAYRRDMRLRTAANLTRTYRGHLAALALEVGFYSHSHFSAAFRRAFGRAPSLQALGSDLGSAEAPRPRA